MFSDKYGNHEYVDSRILIMEVSNQLMLSSIC